MRAIECTFPREAFASTEEVRHAHQLRLQLREYFLRRPVPPARPWSVGADWNWATSISRLCRRTSVATR